MYNSNLITFIVLCVNLLYISAQDVVDDIFAGGDNTCVIYSPSKKIKCYGDNQYGQLGQGDTTNHGDTANTMGTKLPFINVGSGPSNVVDKIIVATGRVCVLLTGKQLKCWGLNEGLLGLGDKGNRGDDAGEMGDKLPLINFGSGKLVQQFVAGFDFGCSLIDDGKVVCFGKGEVGQLGNEKKDTIGDDANEMGSALISVKFGTAVTSIDSIHTSGSAQHACAVVNKSKFKCWGSNAYGQLGLGNTVNRGDLVNTMGDKLPFVDIGLVAGIKAVTLGATHTCLITLIDKVLCWGYNFDGTLGRGTSKDVGDGPKEMGKLLVGVNWGKKLTAKSLSAGNAFTCGLLSNGGIKCYGVNNYGQLGQGDILSRGNNKNTIGDKVKVIDFGTTTAVKRLTSGNAHSCVLFVDGKVKCYGINNIGQLGLESTNDMGNEPNEMGLLLPYVSI